MIEFEQVEPGIYVYYWADQVDMEAIPDGIFASRQQARMALFDYIEVFCNRQRLHSGIDYACPVSRAA